MLGLIKKVIEGGRNREATASDREQETHVAACVVLLEAAHVDNHCSQEEMDHVIDTLTKKFNLSREYTEELIELAHAKRDDSLDLWRFTRHMNQQWSEAEKMALMEDVWRIIHADGQMEKHEDYFARKLANLLLLTHRQMIDAKIRAKGGA